MSIWWAIAVATFLLVAAEILRGAGSDEMILFLPIVGVALMWALHVWRAGSVKAAVIPGATQRTRNIGRPGRLLIHAALCAIALLLLPAMVLLLPRQAIESGAAVHLWLPAFSAFVVVRFLLEVPNSLRMDSNLRIAGHALWVLQLATTIIGPSLFELAANRSDRLTFNHSLAVLLGFALTGFVLWQRFWRKGPP